MRRRQIASVLCGFFDPLGWYIPFTNKLKVLLHECWEAKLTWDDPLPLEIQEKTKSISQDMSCVANIQINRWIKYTSNSSSIELHGYGDASSIMYSTCVYLVFSESNTTISNLMCAKSRVALKRQFTIPRLELLAALLTARLIKKLLHSCQVNSNSKSSAFQTRKLFCVG